MDSRVNEMQSSLMSRGCVPRLYEGFPVPNDAGFPGVADDVHIPGVDVSQPRRVDTDFSPVYTEDPQYGETVNLTPANVAP